MLLAQSLRTSLGARFWTIAAVLGVLGALALGPSWNARQGWAALNWPVALLAALTLGVTAFAGDQTLGRIRFLADRGVSPRKLITARLLPPLTWMLVLCTAAIWAYSQYIERAPTTTSWMWSTYIPMTLCVACFALGALSAMCHAKPMFAWLISILLLFALPIIYGATFELLDTWFARSMSLTEHERYFRRQGAEIVMAIALPIGIAFWFGCLYWLAPRWLIEHRPRLGLRFLAIVAIGGLMPLVVPVSITLWLSIPA